MFDAKTGKQLWTKKEPFDSALVFSPDGQFLVGSMHSAGYQLTVSNTGKAPPSVGEDYFVKVWDAKTGVLKRTLKGQEDTTNCMTFSANGEFLAVEKRGTVEIWDAKKWTLLKDLKVSLWNCDSIAFLPDAKRFAVKGRQIEIWDWHTGKKLIVLENSGEPRDLVLSRDGKFLAGYERKIYYDNGDKLLARLGCEPHRNGGNLMPTFKELFWSAVLQHRRKETLQRDVLLVWDVATGKIVKQLITSDTIFTVAIAPDGKTVASLGDYGRVRLWDTSDLYL